MVSIQNGIEPGLETKEWTRYLTYLTIFLSIVNFFSLFNIVFSGLVLMNLATFLDIEKEDLLLIFTITGFSGLLTIIPRYLTDRYGRKPLILLNNVVLLTCIIGSYLTPNIIIFISFQFIGGILGINISSLFIAEEVPARYRGKSIGIYTGIGMSSSILASYLFTFVGESLDIWRFIYFIVSISGLIIITSLWFRIKETKRFIHCQKTNLNKLSAFRVFQRKYLRILALSGLALFLTDWIYLTIKRYFIIFLVEERGSLGFTTELIGSWLILIYMGSIIGYYLSGYLADRIGRKKSIYINVGIYFIGSLIFLFFGDMVYIFVGLFILNLTFAIYRLIAEILAVEFWPTELRGIGSGWVFVLAATSGIIGNFVMFFIVEGLGGWGNMFLVIGTICLIALVIITHYIPETKQRVVEEIYLTEIEKLKA
jgi:MFS family permease